MEENVVRNTLGSLGFSSADFARLVGVTPRAVSLWLSSQREIPRPVRAYASLLLSLPPSLRRAEIENTLSERKKPMWPFKYKFLLWQLIAASDSGKYDTLSYEEVRRHANDGNAASFMKETFRGDFDLSVFEPSDWTTLNETWANIANAVDARRNLAWRTKASAY
jgi:hypothetical protein